MFKIVVAASAALLTVATPAFAADAKDVASPAIAALASAEVSAVSLPTAVEKPVVSKRQRYCVIENGGWSRIEQRTCRTRLTWLSYGFDPIKK